MEEKVMPWQKWEVPKEVTSNEGEVLEKIYELEEDKYTNEKSLKETGTYDQQEYINSFADEADPITLMQRVKMGTVAPWNGQNCFDMTQMPKDMVEINERIRRNGKQEMEDYANYLRAKAELERYEKEKNEAMKENGEESNEQKTN